LSCQQFRQMGRGRSLWALWFSSSSLLYCLLSLYASELMQRLGFQKDFVSSVVLVIRDREPMAKHRQCRMNGCLIVSLRPVKRTMTRIHVRRNPGMGDRAAQAEVTRLIAFGQPLTSQQTITQWRSLAAKYHSLRSTLWCHHKAHIALWIAMVQEAWCRWWWQQCHRVRRWWWKVSLLTICCFVDYSQIMSWLAWIWKALEKSLPLAEQQRWKQFLVSIVSYCDVLVPMLAGTKTESSLSHTGQLSLAILHGQV